MPAPPPHVPAPVAVSGRAVGHGRRLAQCLLGLALFGPAIALQVRAGLGVGPWDVLHQGISLRTGVPMGTVAVLLGLPILLLWIPLRQRVGVGTVLNTILVGLILDGALLVIPDLRGLLVRWVALVVSVVLMAVAIGLYIGAGLGAGPRDGVMVGLAARGVSVRVARTGMELTVLVAGWFLGGSVGAGTVVVAFGLGPLVQVFLGRFALPPRRPQVRAATPA